MTVLVDAAPMVVVAITTAAANITLVVLGHRPRHPRTRARHPQRRPARALSPEGR